MEPLRLTVIIEWENVLLAEIGRSREMLGRLQDQIRTLRRTPADAEGPGAFLSRFRGPVELLVLYNDEAVDSEAVRSIVTSLVEPGNEDVALQILPAPGLHYYELKNYGVRRATGDIVLFLDSDVIPQEGWLAHLLGPFADPEVPAVGGDSCIDPATLVGKAFALFWFFDLPSKEGGRLFRKQQFWANNVAFRREILLRFPFPKAEEGVNRGACAHLSGILAENGIWIYRNSAARVSHPAPNGLSHFFNRAISEGRDHVFFFYRDPRTLPRRHALSRLRTNLRSLRSIARERARVGLPAWQVPIAVGVGATYRVLQFYGEVRTRGNPDLMRRRHQI